MSQAPRASTGEHRLEAGERRPLGLPSGTVTVEERQSWYDADAVTFAAGDDVRPGRPWQAAWPPETRSLETRVRELVVAARRGTHP